MTATLAGILHDYVLSPAVFWPAIGAIAIPTTIIVFAQAEGHKFYTDLDESYQEILLEIVRHPSLAGPPREPNAAEQARYDAYAYVVWNFLETIHDRCGASRPWPLRPDHLWKTWEPVLRYEAGRHAAWFNEKANRKKFKASFQTFIDRNGYARAG